MLKHYDLLLPLGNFCLASHLLRMNNLQCESYPMDWLMFNNWDDAIRMIERNFADLLNEKYLEKISEHPLHDVYRNNLYDMELRHDFRNDISFEQNLEVVGAKYQRRIERINKRIAQANKILIVHVEQNNQNDDAYVSERFQRLEKFFADKYIEMLFLNFKTDAAETVSEDITPQIRKITLKVNSLTDYESNKILAKPLLAAFRTNWRVHIKQQLRRILIVLRKPFLKLIVGGLPLPAKIKRKIRNIYKERWA